MMDKQRNIEIGKRLEACRKRIGVIPEEMAVALGMSYKDYIGMESGDVSLNLDIVVKLEEQFNVNCRYLLVGKEAQYSSYLAEILEKCPDEKKESLNYMLLHMVNLLKDNKGK